MSSVTADLEYFKCDLCGVYFHRDIFCDHRRECKGLDSTELKKSECRQIEAALNEEMRRRFGLGEAGKTQVIPIELAERHQQARVRRNVANAYQSEIDKKLEEQFKSDKMKALAAFLEE
ncbi:uncharacterized protein TM35_000361220 [Trypanosoma theileri]|uniref:Uncharacterized protein n=1 Tax=Trypanosoma theileri TaxID=67003 RepID=A0A1X0NKI3_9TRYP|nr:uncharacterized protein TM35_000361220 [Trypanosoma theileri]ORC85262.1 hypothetical protein TM35_000361220 [Trypanosoma theileri]